MNYSQKAKIFSAEGSLSQRWYINISIADPNHPGKFKRIRRYCDINHETTVTGRMRRAKHHLKVFVDLLESGWNPIEPKVIGAELPAKRYTVNECLNIYLPYKKSVVSFKTYAKYKHYLNTFLEWSGCPLYLDEIRKKHVLEFLEYKRQTWGNKTANNFVVDLSTFLNHWVDNFDDVLPKNYITKMGKLPTESEGNTAYSDKQIINLKKLMLEHQPYVYFFCLAVYNTCTRPQTECRLLKCGDFDFARKRLTIGARIAKANQRGFVPLSNEFIELLKERSIDSADPDDYVFTVEERPGKNPIAQKTLQKRYRKIKELTKLKDGKFSIYSWKHTRNIHAWLDTKDIMFIKELNRHSSLEMTMKYLRDLGCFVDSNDTVNKLRSL